jgi:dipeptidyl aminopeptidase/acylaminoacyl peptidase
MLKELRTDDAAPWKQRFRAPMIAWTQLARSAPERGLACSNKSGAYQLYAWDVPGGELRQLTNRPTGLLFGVLSHDGRYLYYIHDEQGNEIGHYVRVPFEGGEPEDITPDMAPYSSFDLTASLAGNMVGMTIADAEGFHVHCIDLGQDGELSPPRLIYSRRALMTGPYLSHGGEIGVMASTERTGTLNYSLVALDTTSGNEVGELWDGPESSVEAVGFAPVAGDLRLLATSNRTGLKRPLIWDLGTGERTDIELEDLEGEVVPFDWSPDGRRILLCQFNRAVQQLYTYEVEGGRLVKLEHPGGTFGFFASVGVYFGPEGQVFAQWQDSSHPSRLIELDGRTGAVTRTLLAAGDVPPGHPWRSVSFASSDGQEIQGWLGVPDGEGPFPTILHTHGGPESVTTELFSAGSQAWLDHGFAFLTINYRGSTTFGRAFQEQIRGNLGHWEVEDMVAARDWLVREKVAIPDQILVTGGSYGGYLTLLPLGKRPDLWAGGMALVAIADWALLYEDGADTLKGYDVALFGGTPDEKREQYAASSPITYAENVAAPLLIIQGRNDTRCPDRQMEVYVEKLRALGKPVEIHWFDAGHGAFEVSKQIEHQELMLRFAYRTLGR